MINNNGIPSPFYNGKPRAVVDSIVENDDSLSDSDMKEIWEFLEKKTGAKGFILITSPDEMPCAEEKAGKVCTGHYSNIYNHGIHGNYVRACLEMILEVASKYGK